MWRLCETGDAVDAVIITPEPGRHKEIGQQLLALADSPRDVQWTTWPTAGYAVPVELFAKFAGTQEPASGGAVTKTPVIEDPPAFVEPKRRGRPRKEPSTDNNSEEE